MYAAIEVTRNFSVAWYFISFVCLSTLLFVNIFIGTLTPTSLRQTGCRLQDSFDSVFLPRATLLLNGLFAHSCDARAGLVLEGYNAFLEEEGLDSKSDKKMSLGHRGRKNRAHKKEDDQDPAAVLGDDDDDRKPGGHAPADAHGSHKAAHPTRVQDPFGTHAVFGPLMKSTGGGTFEEGVAGAAPVKAPFLRRSVTRKQSRHID